MDTVTLMFYAMKLIAMMSPFVLLFASINYADQIITVIHKAIGAFR